MAETTLEPLVATSPCAGLLPLTRGTTTLTEETPAAITALLPRPGAEAALDQALQAAHGLVWPAPGRSTGKSGCRLIWTGQDQAMLFGPPADPSLAACAALVDQSDAWAVVRLEGPGAEAVLARLVPLDLRPAHFKRGHTARSPLQHMPGSITRLGEHSFQLMTFRSMAATLVHDLETAMAAVAARG